MTTTNDRGPMHAADEVTRMTLRLPNDLAENLRMYVFLTQQSANSFIVEAVRAYLDTVGRDRMVDASTMDTVKRYSAVLDKLGES